MSSDERLAERDQRRQAKYARKYGFTLPEIPNMPDMPNPPSFNIQIGEKKYDDMPIDQRPDTRIEPGMSEEEINDRIRRRIALRVKQRNDFYIHLVSFVAVNVMLWGIFLAAGGGGGVPWPMFVTLGWGIGLFAHASQVYQNSPSVSARRERTVQHEIELEKARLGISGLDYEKPKRIYRDSLPPEREVPEARDQSSPAQPQSQRQSSASQRVRLSDDGELIPVEDDIDNNEDMGNRPGQVTRASNDRSQ